MLASSMTNRPNISVCRLEFTVFWRFRGENVPYSCYELYLARINATKWLQNFSMICRRIFQNL